MSTQGVNTPNDRQHYVICRRNLPLHCPLPDMSLWNSHPRVYLPIGKTGTAKCPYCGTEFTLEDTD
ncbi:MAG: zinc-finger domain-containing protein [Gammaproteobacteria bacterium]|nr:zinc-finger domain-containing protein [Gammaproteobacteria bacterium]MCY4211024.1 zinc-finger domain-containing protein [Gammaproteobacteria bacterium]MCY4282231.1 zinc-finger domain-containing protein [Gammaproteobacteria bacterium]MCY4338914.1 zinc-finger domain-containing protein [Gammaproteobacteria bacterium]